VCFRSFSQLQIIGSVSINLGVEWPPLFQEFLQTLTVFSFDFLSPDCFTDGGSFYSTVIIWSVGPILLSVLIGLSYAVRGAMMSIWEPAPEARRQQLYSNHLKYFLVLSFVVLPASTLKQ
jgi:hypothetical protein